MAGVAALVASFEPRDARSAAVRAHAALLTACGSRSVHAGGQVTQRPCAWDWRRARHEAVLAITLDGGGRDAAVAAVDRLEAAMGVMGGDGVDSGSAAALVTLLTLLARPRGWEDRGGTVDVAHAAVVALFQPAATGDVASSHPAGPGSRSPLAGTWIDGGDRDDRIAALFAVPSPTTQMATPAHPLASDLHGGIAPEMLSHAPWGEYDGDTGAGEALSIVRALFTQPAEGSRADGTPHPAPVAPSGANVSALHSEGATVTARARADAPISQAPHGDVLCRDRAEGVAPAVVDWPLPHAMVVERRWDAPWCRAAVVALSGGPLLPPPVAAPAADEAAAA
jgi:hypothetical protein